MKSISVLIALLFFIPEVVYGVAVGKIKKGKDIIEYMAEGVRSLAGFIAMAIVIGQFLRIFSMSNIGTLVGIKGGELLSKSSLPPQLIVVLFILLVVLINLLIVGFGVDQSFREIGIGDASPVGPIIGSATTGHACVLLGWKTIAGHRYWIVQNSWTTQSGAVYGDNGLYYIPWQWTTFDPSGISDFLILTDDPSAPAMPDIPSSGDQ